MTRIKSARWGVSDTANHQGVCRRWSGSNVTSVQQRKESQVLPSIKILGDRPTRKRALWQLRAPLKRRPICGSQLPTLLPTGPTQVMPHCQKSKSCKLKEDLQAPREAQGLVSFQAPIAEEDVTTTSSSSSLSFDPGHSRGGTLEYWVFSRVPKEPAPPLLPSQSLQQANQMRALAAKKRIQAPHRVHQILSHCSLKGYKIRFLNWCTTWVSSM